MWSIPPDAATPTGPGCSTASRAPGTGQAPGSWAQSWARSRSPNAARRTMHRPGRTWRNVSGILSAIRRGKDELMKTMLLTVILALLAGCMTRESANVYGRHEAGREQTVRYGTVDAVRKVTIEGSQTGVGGAAGGIGGAIAGGSVGQGRGSAVAGVLGAVAGGVA